MNYSSFNYPSRNRSPITRLKRSLQIPCAIAGGATGVGLVGWLAWTLVSALLAMIPAGPWAGLIKVGIVFASFWAFGGVAVLAAFLLAVGLAALIAALMD